MLNAGLLTLQIRYLFRVVQYIFLLRP